MRIGRIRLPLFVIVLALAGTACSSDGETTRTEAADVASVDATMRAADAALAAGDVNGFMELWTDTGLQQVFNEFGDAFVANSGYYVGAKQYSLGAASTPTVVGDTATTVAPLFFRLVGAVREFSLVQVNGSWKVDGATLTSIDVSNATTVDLAFGESSLDLDPSAITDGDIAMQIHNPTTRSHELNILTAPPEQDLTVFFEHPEDAPPVPEGRSMPEGFDFVGGIVDIEPGANVTVLFSAPLPAARYVMFCNAEDSRTSTPHSESGEYLDFTVA